MERYYTAMIRKAAIFLITVFLILIIFFISFAQQNQKTSASSKSEMNGFIRELMNKMTLEEKIGQLNLVSVGFDVTGPIVSQDVEQKIRKGLVGGVFNTFTPIAVKKLQRMAVEETRLKIPLLFGFDVVHGHRTIFPVPLGLSASWDLQMIERSARIAADEASADGLNWVFSPMVDIARDPRWGRIIEGSGEDAWYGSRVAEAMVHGYQGVGSQQIAASNTVMACVKHFAIYGAAQAGRDYGVADMGERTMFENYLPPYKAAIDAGAWSVMSSFNEINGVPAASNAWLLTDLLRKRWGFNGLVVSDYTGLSELIPHGVSANEYEAAAMGIKAGNDMDMVSEVYLKNLQQLVKDGVVAEAQINAACQRVLEAKYKLGLFDDPYRYVDEQRAKQTMLRDEYREAARDIARKSMVLLKNEKNVLPLRQAGSIALIGPLAKNQRDLIGNWSGAGDWKKAVTVEQGIRNAVGANLKINYAKGANLTNDLTLIQRLDAHGGNLEIDKRSDDTMIKEAIEAAKKSDVIVAVVGESQGMTGEAACRADITLPGKQLDLLKALKKTGKPLVIVLMNGRPLALTWENENADAILETWFSGTESGNAIADVLFGMYNPAGKLTVTFPQHVGQVPLFYNHKNTGRPYGGEQLDKYKSRYLDVSNEPLYPFGYGLSYTSFEYGDVVLSQNEITTADKLTVSCRVTNAGKRDGEEVVQLYVRDVTGSVTRPVKELKGFQKVMLKAGESKNISFTIGADDLSFYRIDMTYGPEAGKFIVFVGGNSRDVKQAEFAL
ncbi:MAG: beta-glucosidase BglX, partial [Bacteroidota bacterium]